MPRNRQVHSLNLAGQRGRSYHPLPAAVQSDVRPKRRQTTLVIGFIFRKPALRSLTGFQAFPLSFAFASQVRCSKKNTSHTQGAQRPLVHGKLRVLVSLLQKAARMSYSVLFSYILSYNWGYCRDCVPCRVCVPCRLRVVQC